MSTASLVIDDWIHERSERERRDIRRRLVASVGGHLLLGLLLIGLPAPSRLSLPAVVSVDLLAAVPRPAPAAAKSAPPSPAPKPPAPEPVIVPPPPQQKTRVLPREAPRAKPKPVAKRTPKAPLLGYDDALSSLRDELGEPASAAEEALDGPPEPALAAGSGRVDPELVAWQRGVERAIARSWVTPTEYRDSELRTLLVVTLMSDGRVLGEPVVRRSSGDPHFDDNAVRAVLQASPLPPPPSSGDWPFLFNPAE